MKVLVIGCGLIGVTTAYVLRRRGHEVTVIDRAEGPGQETSFANGALLTPSMPEPWNAPGCWRLLLASLVRSDAPMQLRLAALPALAGWGIRFLRNSHPSRYRHNTLRNLRLALHSLQVLESIRQEAGIEYGRAARGTLRLFRDTRALERAVASNPLSAAGLTLRRLSRDETVGLEPALAPIAGGLAGAIHYPLDETGNAYRFCVALAERARECGVEFHFRTEAASLEVRSGRLVAVVSAPERWAADKYVVAAGSYSTPLLRRAGVDLPVQPVKGYSVTIEPPAAQRLLSIPIVDDDFHAAVVPLEGAIRVAGTAEFAGYDLAPNPPRIRYLLRLARQLLPQLTFEPAAVRPWWGLRPMSVDGVPIIGPTPIADLLVNAGHGHLGWTMAAGSAEVLADLIDGRTPSVDPAPYALGRFH